MMYSEFPDPPPSTPNINLSSHIQVSLFQLQDHGLICDTLNLSDQVFPTIIILFITYVSPVNSLIPACTTETRAHDPPASISDHYEDLQPLEFTVH